MGRVSKSHVVSAVIGGVIVSGAFVVLGVTGPQRTETIFEEAPVAAHASADPRGLTANDIYVRAAPAVVLVRAKLVESAGSPFDPFRSANATLSTGSGFLVDRQGDILTNYHVIRGADRRTGITVQFEADTIRTAGVIATDPANDLAVLRVDMHGVPPIRPLPLGDSSSVRVGDLTLALGDPFGDDRTLTSGIVAALQHQVQAADGQTIDNLIQTDQPLDAGNSGGPLLNGGGQVVGIDTQIATADPSQNLTFAIPIDTADAVLARVDHNQAVHVAFLGISAPPVKTASRGAVVGAVTHGGPADIAGLEPKDQILRVDGVPVDSISDVLALVSTRSPGQSLRFQIRRGHTRRTLSVVLGSRTVPPPSR
ncbi:MAG TPA: trypsin-like peptidase domain-containing protein [Solirubrobacteraceae bacterium]|nr:trypsin-like peptidase domain-containing protein [Solirubrobacteraceae bacterium]